MLNCAPEPVIEGEATITCQVPSLAPREEVQATVLVVPSLAGTIGFSGQIEGDNPVTQNTTVTVGADLELGFVAEASIQAGEFLSFQAVITNHGPYDGDSTRFTMLLPAALSHDIAMPAGCSIAGNEVTCDVTGPIPADGVITLDFETQVLTGDDSNITVAGSIEGSVPADPDLSNDASEFGIAVQPGTDVFLHKSRQPSGLVYLGEEVTFTLSPDFAGGVPLNAIITDSLPSNYEFVSVSAGQGWICDPGHPVNCTYSSASPDAAAYRAGVTITAMPVTPTTDTRIENIAEIASSTDVVASNNTASDGGADIAVPATDLVAQKSGPRHSLVTVGNEYNWHIWARNEGNVPFDGRLILTDHLPEGLSATGYGFPADQGWNCLPAASPTSPVVGPQDIVCTTDRFTGASPLAIGQESGAVRIQALVTQEGPITNSLTVSDENATYSDGDLSNNTITNGVTSGDDNEIGTADLSVRKSVTSSGPYDSGDPVTFEVEISNAGPGAAQTVRMVDRLEDLYFADSTTTAVTIGSAPGMDCEVTRGAGFYSDLVCTIDELPNGATATVTFTALVGDEGAKTNTAEVYSTVTPDPNYDNNTDNAGYTVTPRTDVTVEKTASHANGAEVQAGQELIYVLHASVPDLGLSRAHDVMVTDTLPAGLRIVSVTPDQGSCSPVSNISGGLTTDGSQLVCNLGTIVNNGTQTVRINAVPSTSIAGTSITNDVTVSTSTPEINPANNDASITHVITRPTLDLVTNKVDADDPLEVGNSTFYTITVQNTGPSEAFNVVITDILPTAGMEYNGHTPGAGMTCQEDGATEGGYGGQLVCEVANLPVGSVAELQVDMTADAHGRWTNRVEVLSDEYYDEPNKANNDVAETTDVFERSNLSVTKEASKTPVDLGEPFDWQITVLNATADGIGLAEDVVLRDTLPANMVIAGSVSTLSTTGTGASCDAPQDGRNLICIVDDMEAGHSLTVTLPVRVISVAANPEEASNSAVVETASFDENPDDNTSTGTVEVRSTSVSGSVWRDFNDDEIRDADHDSGFAGLNITLTGTDEWGDPVPERTVQTGPDGSYSFDLLPPGDYRVSYAPPSGRYEIGSALPDTGNGAAENATTIASISATTDAPAPGNDFTLIPQAQIALAKAVAAPVMQADGSWRVDYTFRILNESEEPVSTFRLTDALETDFGTLVSGTPDRGQFSLAGNSGNVTPGSSSGGVLEFIMAGPIAAGASEDVTLSLLVNPSLPRVAPQMVLTNNATIEGTGDWSTQEVSDGSNNGNTPAHGNLSDTTATITFDPEITLEKTATLDSTGTVPVPGDRIDYTFTIQNTGNTPLQNVTITDPMPGLVWDANPTIPLLNPGEEDSTSYTAHYVLTQDDIENGGVENIATTNGRWAVDGVPDPFVSDDDEAAITALALPGLEIVKSAIADVGGDNDPTVVGDEITYTFVITNTGNVTISDLVLTDAMLGLTGSDAVPVGTLVPESEPGDSSFTVQRTYTVTQDDIDAGEVVNTANAAGTHEPDNTPIDADSNEVTTPLFPDPQMRVTKLLDAAPVEPRAGGEVSWTVTIQNTGNTRLEITDIAEPLTGASVSAPAQSVLQPGGTTTATVTYELTQEDIDAGVVLNQVTVSGGVPGSDIPVDPTPSGNDPDSPNEDETVTPLPAVPSIALLKELVTDVSDPLMPGHEIEFDFTIRNTGNVTLDNIELTDDLADVVLDLTPLAGLSLAPDAVVVVTGIYELTAEDIEAGGLTNTATVTAEDPHGTPVEDDSGTGFDNDTPMPVELVRNPQIALLKTISTVPDVPTQAGDVIEYAFEIHNIGNVELRDITLTELVDGVEVLGSRSTPLPVGGIDSDSFTARYELTQADIDAGTLPTARGSMLWAMVPPGRIRR